MNGLSGSSLGRSLSGMAWTKYFPVHLLFLVSWYNLISSNTTPSALMNSSLVIYSKVLSWIFGSSTALLYIICLQVNTLSSYSCKYSLRILSLLPYLNILGPSKNSISLIGYFILYTLGLLMLKWIGTISTSLSFTNNE
jgi:hypothetical protein